MCPLCQKSTSIVKRGKYIRASDRKIIQRFRCKNCGKSFSSQTLSYDYRLRKRYINQMFFCLYSKGNSQRACAQILGVDKKTIARRVYRFGACARKHLKLMQRDLKGLDDIIFDEMESFEHTKLKPLTIPLAVEKKTRRILALNVGRIAAKGPLAQLSRNKYGRRKCERNRLLEDLFSQLRPMMAERGVLSSDMSHHYPKVIHKYAKNFKHKRFKGRKAAIVGQGEMKKGGHDPLFSLNQTAAMIRDNLKRMARRTWCTTKHIERLRDSLSIYAYFHNQKINGIKMPRMENIPMTI